MNYTIELSESKKCCCKKTKRNSSLILKWIETIKIIGAEEMSKTK
jgi:hypothetical protein